MRNNCWYWLPHVSLLIKWSLIPTICPPILVAQHTCVARRCKWLWVMWSQSSICEHLHHYIVRPFNFWLWLRVAHQRNRFTIRFYFPIFVRSALHSSRIVFIVSLSLPLAGCWAIYTPWCVSFKSTKPIYAVAQYVISDYICNISSISSWTKCCRRLLNGRIALWTTARKRICLFLVCMLLLLYSIQDA